MKLPLRFSVRTLVLLVTLVCAYLGLWDATKRFGLGPEAPVLENGRYVQLISVYQSSSPFPLILRRREGHLIRDRIVQPGSERDCKVRYYLWLFGLKIRLPFAHSP